MSAFEQIVDSGQYASCCRAAVLFNVYEPAVPVEWNRLLERYPRWDLAEYREHCMRDIKWGHIPRKPDHAWTAFNFQMYDGMMVGRPTLTLTTVINAFDSLPDWTRQVLAINMGQVQQYVAAFIMYIQALPAAAREFLLRQEIHTLPIKKLLLLKPLLEAARKVMAVEPADVTGAVYLLLRKMDLLAGRSTADADYVAEEAKMTKGLVLRFWPSKGTSSLQEYACRFATKLNEVAERTVGNREAAPGYEEDLDTWWKSRSRWTATGSSSRRRLVTVPEECGKAARPNKKAVAEALCSGDLYADLLQLGAVFRGSTKPEPGFKQRALYAQDDSTYTRDAFVSRDVEKMMTGQGLMARQAAADVAEWVKAHQATRPDQHWVSLDYTDFNKEHNTYELELVDLAMGRALGNRSRRTRNQRLLLALASGQTRRLGFVTRQGRTLRVFSGLSSGHRNTARDNTMLHATYSQMVIQWAEEALGGTFGHHWVGICGDDEDACRQGLARTAVYLGGHQLFGWTLNPKKQLVSYKWHEFLQRFATGAADPSKPLARNVSALSTGNWYVLPGKYYSMAVQAVTDFGAEMVTRGADWEYTRRVLAGYLDTYFNDGTSKRDWAPSATELERLFWEGAELQAWTASAGPPKTQPGAVVPRALPGKGVCDLIEKDWHVLKALDRRDLARIKESWLMDSHASVLNPTIGKAREKEAFENMAIRRSHTAVAEPKRAAPMLEQWPKLTMHGSRRVLLSNRDLLNRVGMDRRVLDALGGWDRLADHGLGRLMQYWEPERQSSIKYDKFCDWAIMAHYGKNF